MTDGSLEEQLRRVQEFEGRRRATVLTGLLQRVAPTRGFAAMYRRVGPQVDPWLLRPRGWHETDDMWARAAREIARAFEVEGTPLDAVAALDPPPPTLHLYAQPPDPGYLEAQRAFAAAHPWFRVVRLDAASHFPVFEVPDDVARHLRDFVAEETAPAR